MRTFHSSNPPPNSIIYVLSHILCFSHLEISFLRCPRHNALWNIFFRVVLWYDYSLYDFPWDWRKFFRHIFGTLLRFFWGSLGKSSLSLRWAVMLTRRNQTGKLPTDRQLHFKPFWNERIAWIESKDSPINWNKRAIWREWNAVGRRLAVGLRSI